MDHDFHLNSIETLKTYHFCNSELDDVWYLLKVGLGEGRCSGRGHLNGKRRGGALIEMEMGIIQLS
jgi:hypothetical protein